MMENERDQITAEELEDLAGLMERDPQNIPTSQVLRHAASTIRALQSGLAEAEKRKVPQGWTGRLEQVDGDGRCIGSLDGSEWKYGRAFALAILMQGGWHDGPGSAIRAAESAAQEADHADA